MNNYTISTSDIYFLNDKNIISAIDDNLLTNKINPIASYDVVANMSSYISSELSNITNNTQHLCTQIDSNNTYAIASVDTLHTIINSLSDSISSNYALISTIPLSTSQLSNNGDGTGIYMLNNKLCLASGYDTNNYNLCLVYDGVRIAELNANEFIKDSVLSGVELVDSDNNPYLQFTWIVISGGINDKTPITNKIYLSSLTDDLAKQTIVDELSTGIYKYADCLSDAIDNMSSDVSSVLYNVASYHGHIRINKDNSTSSLQQIFHANNLIQDGHIKNGTIIDVEILSGSESYGDASFNKELTYTTSDGFTFHNKDFIIIHDQSRHTMYIDAENISNNNVKIITAVDWPLFYSLCCTVSYDYLWLKGGNTFENNHAISGNNDFINGLNRFEQLSVAKLSANNVDLISGIISNLTANIISSENIDIVLAGISNLTSLNANLSDAGISNLIVNNLSGNNLSIDLSNLINTNRSFNYPNVQTFVTSVELSIDNLSVTLGNKIVIDGKTLGTETLSINHISQDDYHELVLSKEGPLINTLYIVSSDSLNMYGERIENLANPISATDAVNKQYVDSTDGYLSVAIDNKIFAGEDGKLTTVDSLSIVKIDQASYFDLTKDEKTDPHTLYIVNTEGEYNMFNERITNLAAPLSATDATNKQYVDNIQNNIKTKILDSNVLSTIYECGKKNEFDDIDCGQIVSALYELISIFCN